MNIVLMENLKKLNWVQSAQAFIQKIKDEIYYGGKTAHSLLSGFTGKIQSRYGLDFADDVYGENDPYYACPLFKNGRHIPLPFFTQEGFRKSDYLLQDLVLFLLKGTKAYKQAKEACLYYAKISSAYHESIEWVEENSYLLIIFPEGEFEVTLSVSDLDFAGIKFAYSYEEGDIDHIAHELDNFLWRVGVCVPEAYILARLNLAIISSEEEFFLDDYWGDSKFKVTISPKQVT